MIVQGVNVYPRDLEQVLEAHPCVQEAAAFPWVDAHSLHIPVAVVRATTQVSEIDLLVWCEQHLGWKRPARIWFADALPKNASGKVLKRELAQQVSNLLKLGQGSAA